MPGQLMRMVTCVMPIAVLVHQRFDHLLGRADAEAVGGELASVALPARRSLANVRPGKPHDA